LPYSEIPNVTVFPHQYRHIITGKKTSRHYVVSNPEGHTIPMKCQLCDIILPSHLEAEAHLREIHILTCFSCDASFENFYLLRHHRKEEHPQRRAQCRLCKTRCSGWCNLEAHFWSVHMKGRSHCKSIFLL